MPPVPVRDRAPELPGGPALSRDAVAGVEHHPPRSPSLAGRRRGVPPHAAGLLRRGGKRPRTAGDRDDPQPLPRHGPERHRRGVVPGRTRDGGRRGLGPRPGERLPDAGRAARRGDPVRPSGHRRPAGGDAVSRPDARRSPDASGSERDPRRPRPPGDPPDRAGGAWHPVHRGGHVDQRRSRGLPERRRRRPRRPPDHRPGRDPRALRSGRPGSPSRTRPLRGGPDAALLARPDRLDPRLGLDRLLAGSMDDDADPGDASRGQRPTRRQDPGAAGPGAPDADRGESASRDRAGRLQHPGRRFGHGHLRAPHRGARRRVGDRPPGRPGSDLLPGRSPRQRGRPGGCPVRPRARSRGVAGHERGTHGHRAVPYGATPALGVGPRRRDGADHRDAGITSRAWRTARCRGAWRR